MRDKKILIALGVGILLAIVWVIGYRFITFKDDRIHYHANFSLYVNGKQDEFKSTTFYEETQACSSDAIGPKSRVHMHDQKSSIVHVHDASATWGHLFANLGYSLGGKVVQTDNGVYVDGKESKELTFILNGKKVDTVANTPISSEDVLLISYGDEDSSDIQQRYEQITKNAVEYNNTSDPSTCSGSAPVTVLDKLQHAISFGN